MSNSMVHIMSQHTVMRKRKEKGCVTVHSDEEKERKRKCLCQPSQHTLVFYFTI